MRRLAFALALALLCACEPRQPLTRADAVARADSFQKRLGVAWGEPLDVQRPQGADADGHRWWQVRYHPEVDGTDRLILVDHDSGWCRLPPPGWQVVQSREHPIPTLPPDDVKLGTEILIIGAPANLRADELPAEVERLNGLARNTGLAPLFSLRQGRDGAQIVYGWQGDHGMRRDDAVRDWLRLRTTYHDAYWVDLAQ